MIMRTSFAFVCLALLGSCSSDASGQKSRQTSLATRMDSVSYGFGVEIGRNMRTASLDSLNPDAMAMGMRDFLAGTTVVDSTRLAALVSGYQLELQRRMLAKEQAEGEENMRKGEAFLSENGKKQGVTTTASGLQYEVVTAGTGAKPGASDNVRWHYRGTLIDGTEFDSSYKTGQPVEYSVTGVIPGLTEALQLMPVGSKWKVYIPASLAYGASKGPGGQLPPYSTLIFDVELLDILPQEAGR